jgi:hypothetical protein
VKRLICCQTCVEKIRLDADHREKIIEVVRDAARELTQRFHTLRPAELVLQLPAFGDILHRSPRRRCMSGLPIVHFSAKNDRSSGAIGTNDTKLAGRKSTLGGERLVEVATDGFSILDAGEPLELCRQADPLRRHAENA